MRIYYRLMRYLCQVLFVLLWRIRVFGRKNVPVRGGVLLVCNHQSYLDPIIVTLALPREGNYLARDTLFGHRFFRRLIESLNAFPVKRQAADMGAIKEIIRRLRAGRLVVAFPEGTRTTDGSIGAFHEGALVVAQRAECWIVPALIEGAFRCWPRGRRFPRPGSIRVDYAAAIPPTEVTTLSVAALSAATRGSLLSLRARTLGPCERDENLAAAPAPAPPAAVKATQSGKTG